MLIDDISVACHVLTDVMAENFDHPKPLDMTYDGEPFSSNGSCESSGMRPSTGMTMTCAPMSQMRMKTMPWQNVKRASNSFYHLI